MSGLFISFFSRILVLQVLAALALLNYIFERLHLQAVLLNYICKRQRKTGLLPHTSLFSRNVTFQVRGVLLLSAAFKQLFIDLPPLFLVPVEDLMYSITVRSRSSSHLFVLFLSLPIHGDGKAYMSVNLEAAPASLLSQLLL